MSFALLPKSNVEIESALRAEEKTPEIVTGLRRRRSRVGGAGRAAGEACRDRSNGMVLSRRYQGVAGTMVSLVRPEPPFDVPYGQPISLDRARAVIQAAACVTRC